MVRCSDKSQRQIQGQLPFCEAECTEPMPGKTYSLLPQEDVTFLVCCFSFILTLFRHLLFRHSTAFLFEMISTAPISNTLPPVQTLFHAGQGGYSQCFRADPLPCSAHFALRHWHKGSKTHPHVPCRRCRSSVAPTPPFLIISDTEVVLEVKGRVAGVGCSTIPANNESVGAHCQMVQLALPSDCSNLGWDQGAMTGCWFSASSPFSPFPELLWIAVYIGAPLESDRASQAPILLSLQVLHPSRECNGEARAALLSPVTLLADSRGVALQLYQVRPSELSGGSHQNCCTGSHGEADREARHSTRPDSDTSLPA